MWGHVSQIRTAGRRARCMLAMVDSWSHTGWLSKGTTWGGVGVIIRVLVTCMLGATATGSTCQTTGD